MLQAFVVLSEDRLRSLDEYFGEDLVLDLRLLKVVLERKQRDPGGNDGGRVDVRLLVLDDLAQGSNGVVSCVVELGLFGLLFFRCIIHLVADGILERLKAQHALRLECCTSVLSYHTHTVNGRLSDGAKLRPRVRADLGDDLRVNRAQEVRPEELNHVIQNEEKELLAVLCGLLGDLWKNASDQLLYQVIAMWLMRLEKNAKDLSEGNLQLVLVLVLFLEHGKVLLIQLVIIISIHVLLLVLVVVLLPVIRLLQEFEDLITQHFDT